MQLKEGGGGGRFLGAWNKIISSSEHRKTELFCGSISTTSYEDRSSTESLNCVTAAANVVSQTARLYNYYRQELMTRSLQLYCVRVTAFSQTDLYLY